MSKDHTYEVTVRWTGNTGSGTANYRDYDRGHDVVADGKPTIRGSADPTFRGTTDRWNPEELLVAALSQCHMLSFLSLCARGGVVVTAYQDSAHGVMEMTPSTPGHFTDVLLRPEVTVADPSMVEKATALHAEAHRTCFIANSVNFPVRHEPVVRVESAA